MKAIVLALVGASCLGAWLLVHTLGLPSWALLVFISLFPLYYLLLRYLAGRGLASWERGLRAQSETRASDETERARFGAEARMPRNMLVAWYHPRFLLHERAGLVFRDCACWTEASAHFEAALGDAPMLDRPRLARELWASLRKQRTDRRPDWGAYLEEALQAPDPPYELLEDWADLLIERGRFAEADLKYRQALARASTDGQRFKIYCRIAIACVRDRRFGAADGALHEANQCMPANDPGFRALYERTVAEVAEMKDASRSDQVHLVQIARVNGRDQE
jgi:hypothetical protein